MICEIDLNSSNRKLTYGDFVLTDREEIVKYLRDNFKIDANSMFQVLPQEKTSSILTSSGKENLLNTEKAINNNLV